MSREAKNSLIEAALEVALVLAVAIVLALAFGTLS